MTQDASRSCTFPDDEADPGSSLGSLGPGSRPRASGKADPAIRYGWATRAHIADTIFALSTPAGRSAVAVIRLTGPRAGEALRALTGRSFTPRMATLCAFRDPQTGAALDEGLGLFFPAPASFTGEDCAELQVHGSPPVVRAVCAALAALDGVRPAEPGEFTRRAFEHGKLDLARVEGLADLIDAQTEGQRRLARRILDGGLDRLAEGWRERIVAALAAIESQLDFADEGDVSGLDRARLRTDLETLAQEIEAEVARGRRGAKMREGFFVAICGPPNSGKSTLLNALAGREQAIVSPHAGTTRDPIEVSLELGGLLVTLCDTAGIRDSDDPVEAIGIARARRAAANADLTVWLTAPDDLTPPDIAADLVVSSKADLLRTDVGDLQISAHTGENLDVLVNAIVARAGISGAGDDGVLSRDRLIAAAESMRTQLVAACDWLAADRLELAAAHLQGALAELGRLGSHSPDEAVLDQIFARFCIGK